MTAARRPPWRSSLQNYGDPRPPLTGDRVCTGATGTGGLRGRGLTTVGPTGSPYLRGIGGGNPVPVTGPLWVALDGAMVEYATDSSDEEYQIPQLFFCQQKGVGAMVGATPSEVDGEPCH